MAKKINLKPTLLVTKYLRDLSIVIIGVLITLLITTFITHKSKQNEVDRAMILIKTEMEENLYSLQKIQHKWETEQKIYALIRENINHIEQIPADSLRLYKKVIGDKHSLSIDTDSYEVFKSSLLMQYIENKEFLSQLSRVYGMQQLIADKLAHYTAFKADGLNHLMNHSDQADLDRWMTSSSIYDFYNMPLNDNVFRTFVYSGGSLISINEFEQCQHEISLLIERLDRQDF